MSTAQRDPSLLDRELDTWAPLLDWRPWFGALGHVKPALDLYEAGHDLIAKCYIPGLDQKDISVEVTDDLLKISGETKREQEVREQDMYLQEMSYGSFARAITLPKSVEATKATAQYDKGTIIVRLPIAATAKPNTVSVKVI